MISAPSLFTGPLFLVDSTCDSTQSQLSIRSQTFLARIFVPCCETEQGKTSSRSSAYRNRFFALSLTALSQWNHLPDSIFTDFDFFQTKPILCSTKLYNLLNSVIVIKIFSFLPDRLVNNSRDLSIVQFRKL